MSHELGKVHHCLVDVFLGQLFPDDLQGDFQRISRFRLELYCTFSACHPDMIVQRVQIWKVWGQSFFILLNGESSLIATGPVLHDARTLKNSCCLG